MRVSPRPGALACARLANSGSLLLPVSNLTNLLAFGASGLSFGRFTALMAGPWLLAGALEWSTLRTAFRRDLRRPAEATTTPPVPPAPRYALTVLLVTVALFVVASSVDVAPAWAAVIGCAALLGPRAARRDVRPLSVLRETSPGFCLFVLALAVVVDGVTRHGLRAVLKHLVPSGTSLPALLAVALLAAILANVVNNLPATLALVPLLGGSAPLVLAMLLGVNLGPNATYPGSLATLLWRRQVPAGDRPSTRQFHALGLLTVPILLVVCTTCLWVGVRTIGVA